MSCGARQIIATAVDLLQSEFTDRMDGLLLRRMSDERQSWRALRTLQTEMMFEWERGMMATERTTNSFEDVTPLVWAYYQAFGVEQEWSPTWPYLAQRQRSSVQMI